MFSANPILSRTLAILLLVVVVTIAWSFLIAPVFDQRASYKADIDRSQGLIAAFEARQEKIGALTRQLTALRSDSTSKTAYFTARNATLAAAKLQSRIKSLTQAARARLTSSQVLTRDDGKSELQRITIRAHMVGSIEAVRSVFHSLEAGQPHIFIDNVTISARQSRRKTRHKTIDQGAASALTVRYEAYGFLRRKQPSEPGR